MSPIRPIFIVPVDLNRTADEFIGNQNNAVCVNVGDMESLRCDRFSIIVIKPEEEIKSASALNDQDLWKPDNASDPSLYMEKRYVFNLHNNYNNNNDNNNSNKLATYGTDGRLLLTANFKVT